MAEELEKAGLYIDDIYRLRVQDPRIANDANDLREECLEYAAKLNDLQKLANDFYKIISNYAANVEKEKLRAIAAKNHLKTMAKQRQNEQQIYQSQIQDKTLELERLRNEYQHLQRIETEQQELLNNLLIN